MTDIKGPLTIIELRASNIKRLSVVRIKPDGSLVQVTGKNGNGKSSVLDSIWMALDWANSVKPSEPIRKGANEAMIKLDMGEIKATRTFRKNTKGELVTELRLEMADGSNVSSPQTILNGLIGELSFEPMEFLKSDDKTKFETMRSFVPGVDFDKIERQRETDFANRTDENRRAKEIAAQAAGIIVPEKMEAQRIDVTKVIADLEAAEAFNKLNVERQQRRKAVVDEAERLEGSVTRIEERIQERLRQIEGFQSQKAEAKDAAKALRDKLTKAQPLPEDHDTAALRDRITLAQTVNSDLDKYDRKMTLLSQAGQHEAAAKALTAALDARDEDVRAKIAAAEMPVPGLTLSDGKVYLNGQPLDQASQAEKLRLSVAVAMAKNPKIKVIRITEGGNDLDEDSMALLRKMAEENGFQVWIERIKAEGGPPAVVMEDGHAQD